MAKEKPYLSFVIPAKDEEKTVAPLHKKIVEVAKKLGNDFEIIFVDDGSTDDTLKNLKTLRRYDKKVKIIAHRGNWGKSVALQNGFNCAKGEIIITLDADLQDNPKEIPRFLREINKGYDLVVGWKAKRRDPLAKTIPSQIGNFVARHISKVEVHDMNCGFKAYKRDVAKNLNLYGELYRFIPILAGKQNFKVGEIIVKHKERAFGESKFGWERNTKGLLDLVTVIFLTGYITRPGHFFGTLGLVSFFFGFVIGLYISYLRFTTGSIQYRHPLLFLGILLMVIGVQLVSTGLLAELVIHSRKRGSSASAIEETL